MSRGRLAFGRFVLNAEAGTLLREGEPVPVGYRAFLLLTAFLNRPGEVDNCLIVISSVGFPRTLFEIFVGRVRRLALREDGSRKQEQNAAKRDSARHGDPLCRCWFSAQPLLGINQCWP